MRGRGRVWKNNTFGRRQRTAPRRPASLQEFASLVLDGGGVRAVVADRAGDLVVVRVGRLRLELDLLEVVQLRTPADDGGAHLRGCGRDGFSNERGFSSLKSS